MHCISIILAHILGEYTCSTGFLSRAKVFIYGTAHDSLGCRSQRLIEAAAAREGSSLSRWARGRLVEAASPKGWPEGFSELFGSVSDESFEVVPDLDWSDDGNRESF
jgi:hypothetical protein